jgi:hypothetical protein
MPPPLWQDIVDVATLVPTGYARLLMDIWDFYQSLNDNVEGSLAYAVERRFWET